MVRVRLNRTALEVAITRENLSQRDLADRIGFSRSHLSHIISGRREPSPFFRRRLMEHFKEFTFDDLFTIEENGNGNRDND